MSWRLGIGAVAQEFARIFMVTALLGLAVAMVALSRAMQAMQLRGETRSGWGERRVRH